MEILLIGVVVFLFWCFYRHYSYHFGENGAPYVPLEARFVDRVIKWAKIKEGDVLYDLGSGDGRIVIAAALKGAQASGIEINKILVFYSNIWIKLFRLGHKAKIISKNIFNVDFSNADIVTTYLLPETNQKLQEKLEKELKKGARVISIGFRFPNWTPIAIDPDGPIYGPIYIYQR